MSRARNGGLPARLAVARWALRVFRRDWRQQVLVVTLLTFTVAGALVGISAVYNAPRPVDARYGSANLLMRYDNSSGKGLDSVVAAARAAFGTIDVIGLRRSTIPGLTRPVEVRDQDPHGPYGAGMLRVVSGRYPTGFDEAAVTDDVAALMRVHVGGQLTLAERTWSVVGVVENPGDLNAEFVLVPPSMADPPESVTILATANPRQLKQSSLSVLASATVFRPADAQTTSATYAFALVALAMLLVCFVAVAAFIAMAQRRMRQFGLLAATGATERHVRLVMLANGAMAGVVAAVLGSAVATPLWTAGIPLLEPAVGHRIDRLGLPWGLIGACLLLAVVTATVAAWWPARAAARVPVTQALSLRPPHPRPAGRWAFVGALLLAAGVICLWLAQAQENVALAVVGSAAAFLGLPFIGVLAIRLLARAGGRLPVASRLALRDLGRHQARSGAALAAISLGLAVAAIVVLATAVSRPPADEGNLSDRQLLIAVGNMGPGMVGTVIPDQTEERIAAVDESVARFAASLGTPTVIPLDAAINPNGEPDPDIEGGPAGRTPAYLTVPAPALLRDTYGRLYIATPELLRFSGVDPSTIRPGIEVLTPHAADDLVFGGPVRGESGETKVEGKVVLSRPAYRSLPDSFLTPEGVRRHGLTAVRAGWLIQADRPLTTAQLAAARDLALDNGLTVESRDNGPPQAQIRGAATAFGGVLAIGVLAMTIGLIRGEAARDLRTLTAAGASRRIQRTLAATTALGLAQLGAILGIAVAYLTVAAILGDKIGLLKQVPVAELAVTVVGVPLVAAAGAWLLAGREPRSLGRAYLD